MVRTGQSSWIKAAVRTMQSLVSDRTTGLKTYSFEVPNVYQIELVGGVCNLKCPECPVTKGEVVRRQNFFDVKFIDVMRRRGDFKNTFYVELQMYGEPLLHPKFDMAVKKLKKAGLMVGVSTNGTIWRKGLKHVDFITLSADSVQYRIGRNEEAFSDVLKRILEETEAKVDVQVIEINDWQEQVRKLKKMFKGYEDRVLIRTVPDCFGVKVRKTAHQDFCVNVLTSVSIHSDGDVVPCCFAWEKELVIGNIYEQSLAEIWQGERRKKLLKGWFSGKIPKKCENCKFRSPQLLHWRFWINWTRRRWFG